MYISGAGRFDMSLQDDYVNIHNGLYRLYIVLVKGQIEHYMQVIHV